MFGAGLTAERDIIVVGDGLGTDEAALEVRMNDAGRLRRLRATRNGPGCRLLRAGGEIGDQIEERIAGADQPVEARLLEADRSQVFSALLRRPDGDFCPDFPRNHPTTRT